MTTAQTIAFVIIAVAIIVFIIANRRRVDDLEDALCGIYEEFEEREDHILEMVASLADKVAKTDERLDELEGDLDVKMESLEEETRRMREFNDGVDGIMAFGKNIPKLNKDAVRR